MIHLAQVDTYEQRDFRGPTFVSVHPKSLMA